MLVVVFYTSTSLPAQAIFCSNCKNVAQGVFDAIKSTFIGVQTTLGTVNQTLDTVNNKVLKPLKDAATLAQIVKSGQLTRNLVTAATGGDALLVSNPQLYLKNKGIAITQGGIDTLASQNGIYSNSIMNSIVAKAKIDNSSLATTLTAINQSSIPTIQKEKICNDASLSEMAKSQVALSGGDYNAVKANLNSTLCSGNPATDPALAKRLIEVSNKNPSLDTFYAITSGDNAYTKGQLAQQATDKAAEAAKTNASKDTTSGGGIKSKTTCTKFASNGLCIEETVAQASSVINKAYNDALSSDLKVAISSIGSGAGSILGAFANTISLFNGLNSAVNGISGGNSNSGSGNTGTLGTVTIPGTATNGSGSTNTNTVVNTAYTSSTGYSQDLTNNTQKKAAVADSPKEMLRQHLVTLNELKNTDNDFISTISSYNSQLEIIKSCYDKLISKPMDVFDEYGGKTVVMSPGILTTDPRFVAAQNFYIQKKNKNTATLNQVTAELSKINTASTLITNAITTIDNSNSTDEITAVFNDYQNKIKNQDLPDFTSGATNLSKQMELDGELQISRMEGGEIFNLNATCSDINTEINNQNRFGA